MFYLQPNWDEENLDNLILNNNSEILDLLKTDIASNPNCHNFFRNNLPLLMFMTLTENRYSPTFYSNAMQILTHQNNAIKLLESQSINIFSLLTKLPVKWLQMPTNLQYEKYSEVIDRYISILRYLFDSDSFLDTFNLNFDVKSNESYSTHIKANSSDLLIQNLDERITGELYFRTLLFLANFPSVIQFLLNLIHKLYNFFLESINFTHIVLDYLFKVTDATIFNKCIRLLNSLVKNISFDSALFLPIIQKSKFSYNISFHNSDHNCEMIFEKLSNLNRKQEISIITLLKLSLNYNSSDGIEFVHKIYQMVINNSKRDLANEFHKKEIIQSISNSLKTSINPNKRNLFTNSTLLLLVSITKNILVPRKNEQNQPNGNQNENIRKLSSLKNNHEANSARRSYEFNKKASFFNPHAHRLEIPSVDMFAEMKQNAAIFHSNNSILPPTKLSFAAISPPMYDNENLPSRPHSPLPPIKNSLSPEKIHDETFVSFPRNQIDNENELNAKNEATSCSTDNYYSQLFKNDASNQILDAIIEDNETPEENVRDFREEEVLFEEEEQEFCEEEQEFFEEMDQNRIENINNSNVLSTDNTAALNPDLLDTKMQIIPNMNPENKARNNFNNLAVSNEPLMSFDLAPIPEDSEDDGVSPTSYHNDNSLTTLPTNNLLDTIQENDEQNEEEHNFEEEEEAFWNEEEDKCFDNPLLIVPNDTSPTSSLQFPHHEGSNEVQNNYYQSLQSMKKSYENCGDSFPCQMEAIKEDDEENNQFQLETIKKDEEENNQFQLEMIKEGDKDHFLCNSEIVNPILSQFSENICTSASSKETCTSHSTLAKLELAQAASNDQLLLNNINTSQLEQEIKSNEIDSTIINNSTIPSFENKQDISAMISHLDFPFGKAIRSKRRERKSESDFIEQKVSVVRAQFDPSVNFAPLNNQTNVSVPIETTSKEGIGSFIPQSKIKASLSLNSSNLFETVHNRRFTFTSGCGPNYKFNHKIARVDSYPIPHPPQMNEIESDSDLFQNVVEQTFSPPAKVNSSNSHNSVLLSPIPETDGNANSPHNSFIRSSQSYSQYQSSSPQSSLNDFSASIEIPKAIHNRNKSCIPLPPVPTINRKIFSQYEDAFPTTLMESVPTLRIEKPLSPRKDSADSACVTKDPKMKVSGSANDIIEIQTDSTIHEEDSTSTHTDTNDESSDFDIDAIPVARSRRHKKRNKAKRLSLPNDLASHDLLNNVDPVKNAEEPISLLELATSSESFNLDDFHNLDIGMISRRHIMDLTGGFKREIYSQPSSPIKVADNRNELSRRSSHPFLLLQAAKKQKEYDENDFIEVESNLPLNANSASLDGVDLGRLNDSKSWLSSSSKSSLPESSLSSNNLLQPISEIEVNDDISIHAIFVENAVMLVNSYFDDINDDDFHNSIRNYIKSLSSDNKLFAEILEKSKIIEKIIDAEKAQSLEEEGYYVDQSINYIASIVQEKIDLIPQEKLNDWTKYVSNHLPL